VDDGRPDNPSTTAVEIFGSVYQVRGHDDSGYLQEVAALVDRRMREVAAKTASADAAKIAILAALNLADELLQSRKRQEGERDEIEERVTVLTGELTAALGR
jgi:cell division protein ZapA